MGGSPIAPEVFNCAAPDTGNMEVLRSLRHRSAEEGVAGAAPRRRDPVGFAMTEPDVASSDATNIDCASAGRRRLRHRWSQVVDVGCARPSLQDRHRDGKDQPRDSTPRAAVDGPGPARHAGRRGAAACSMSSATTTHPTATARWSFAASACPRATCSSAKAGASRSRRAGSGRGASTTACASSASPSGRSGTCAGARRSGWRSVARSPSRARAPRDRQEPHRDRSGAPAHAARGARHGHGRQQGEPQGDRQIKVVAPNVALRVIDRAIQVHGGGGVCRISRSPSAWACARTLRLADGPDEVHRRQIGRLELRKHG